MTNDDTAHVPTPADPPVPAGAHGPDEHSGVVEQKKSFSETVSSLVKRMLLALIGVAILVVLYFILRSIAPRWWADTVASIVGTDAGFTTGVLYGLVIGTVCTAVPLVSFAMAVASWNKLKHFFGVIFLLVGIVFAVPNVMTLAINRADPAQSASIRSAQTKLGDIIGFQGATLIGAIIGGLIALIVIYYIVNYKLRGKKIRAATAVQPEDK